MRAMVLEQVRQPLKLQERAVPEPGPGQVLLEIRACAVCRTDLHVVDGELPHPKLPLIIGHEIVGRVIRLGERASRISMGTRVGVPWLGWTDGVCSYCLAGQENLCVQARFTGYTLDGGYAEYAVADERFCIPIPESYSDTEAAPLLCAGITTYNALRNSGARSGDTVAVQGIGGLGHLAIQFAARMGFRTIAISRGAEKRELAEKLGAQEYIDTQKVTAAEGLQKLGGADLVLATAPNSEAISSTVDGLKPRGKLLIVAAAVEPLKVSGLTLLSGKSVVGWPSGSAFDSEETVAFSVLTGVRPRVEVFKLEQAEQAFGKMMENRVRFRAVLTP